jgi:hypothetical protein
MMAWSEPQSQLLQELKKELLQQQEWREILQNSPQDTEPKLPYVVQGGLILFKDRLVVPTNSPLIAKILKEYHSSPIGGHAGVTRTLARVQAQFYWSKMKQDVKDFVAKCTICQQAKSLNTTPIGLLQPLPIPQQVWEDIAMDFITGLPNSFGFTVIMVVIDRLTKYSHFIAQKTDYTSKTVAEAFMSYVVKLHGIPKSIVSDRDKVFTSSFWQHLFKLQGTSLKMSTAYHPQTDGQSEAVNKCLEMYLRCFTFDTPKMWYKVLPWEEYWYNTALQTSTGMTPFKALYGRDPPSLTRYNYNATDPIPVQEQLTERDTLLARLKSQLLKAQQVMKSQADKKRRDWKFEIGDLVMVKLQPCRQHSAALRKNYKLSMRYFRPFSILERIGAVAYKLELPHTARIHPVFHVSQLKPFKGEVGEPYLPLPLSTTDNGIIAQPAPVIDCRVLVQGQQHIPQVKI